MKFTVEHTNFRNALRAVSRVVNPNAVNPVFGAVHIEAADDRLVLRCTNLDTWLQATLPARVDKPGAALADASDLIAVVDGFREIITVTDTSPMVLSTPRSRYSLLTANPADFPVFDPPIAAPRLVMEQQELKGALSQILFAASKEETRSILMSVLFDLGPTTKFVATDTHRLAYREVAALQSEASGRFVVPSKALTMLVAVLADTAEPITLQFGDMVHVATSTAEFEFAMTVRKLEGAYPFYEKVMPKSSKVDISMDRDALLKALKRVAVVAAHNAEKAVFNLETSILGTTLQIGAESAAVGRAREEIQVEGGAPMAWACNVRYLMDAIEKVKLRRVQFQLDDALKPLEIREEGNTGYRSILMPMQL